MTAPPIDVLMVDDDIGDVDLTREALADGKINIALHVVEDGVRAMAYLRREGTYANAQRPDLILLDLNLPGKDGREVLRELKTDQQLKTIPVVILTTSDAEQDILKGYRLGGNCYITKPVGLQAFTKVVQSIEGFWFSVVKLPPKHG